MSHRLATVPSIKPTASPSRAPIRIPPSGQPVPDTPEPMLVDQYRLSREERARHFSQRLCLYCGGTGYIIATCPV